MLTDARAVSARLCVGHSERGILFSARQSPDANALSFSLDPTSTAAQTPSTFAASHPTSIGAMRPDNPTSFRPLFRRDMQKFICIEVEAFFVCTSSLMRECVIVRSSIRPVLVVVAPLAARAPPEVDRICGAYSRFAGVNLS